MQIGIVGSKEFVVSRGDMLEAISVQKENLITETKALHWPYDATTEPAWFQEGLASISYLDAVLISVPSAFMYTVTQFCLRAGLHVYLDWNSSVSISEYEKLARLSEEAGTELGIDLPLRFHPLFNTVPAKRAASIFRIQRTFSTPSTLLFQQAIDQAFELCYHYSLTSELQRIDAQLVRSTSSIPNALLASLRFQNGTYAHVYISQASPIESYVLQASGTGFNIEVDMLHTVLRQAHPLQRENTEENALSPGAFEVTPLPQHNLHEVALKAFVEAIAVGKPAPASILDGLQTKRIIEKLRKCLR